MNSSAEDELVSAQLSSEVAVELEFEVEEVDVVKWRCVLERASRR